MSVIISHPMSLEIFEQGKRYNCGGCGCLMVDVVPRYLTCSNVKCKLAGLVVMRPGGIQAPVNPQMSKLEGQQ